jgi:hypothetical protein
MNVEDHLRLPLAAVVEAVAAHAEVAEAEVVGLPPAPRSPGIRIACPRGGAGRWRTR